jgi:hypothetical protein
MMKKRNKKIDKIIEGASSYTPYTKYYYANNIGQMIVKYGKNKKFIRNISRKTRTENTTQEMEK